MQEKTKEFAMIKQAVRLQQWSELIKAQQASGLTITSSTAARSHTVPLLFCKIRHGVHKGILKSCFSFADQCMTSSKKQWSGYR